MLVELLLKLVYTLVRATQHATGVTTGDLMTATQPGPRKKHLETYSALAGDRFDMLGDRISETERRLQVHGLPQTGELVEREPSIVGGLFTASVVGPR